MYFNEKKVSHGEFVDGVFCDVTKAKGYNLKHGKKNYLLNKKCNYSVS
jgi:hypothetical protein